MKMMTFTMIFSGGTIPHFIVVKSLGLMDSYGALWLPGLIAVYNLGLKNMLDYLNGN